jgi:transcriptional regulator with XRE-family HTH domain
VPKTSALINDRERAICARVLEVRRAKGWSQSQLAHVLEISLNQLASIEYGRTPLRYGTADRFCRVVMLSQRWLAEGKDPRDEFIFVATQLQDRIPQALLFSQAYDHFLKREMDAFFSKWKDISERAKTVSQIEELRELMPPIVGTVGPRNAFNITSAWLADAIQSTPDYLLQDLASAIGSTIRHFKTKHVKELADYEKREKELGAKKKRLLTSITPQGNDRGVSFADLIRRLRKAAMAHGKKAQLASFMRVEMPRVSEWLSGRKEPGGKNTLRLLQWLATQEEQTKNSGSAINTAGAKSRVRPYENKPKSTPD